MCAMGDWVEFASIKQAAPLMKVLAQYQIGGLRRSGKHHDCASNDASLRSA